MDGCDGHRRRRCCPFRRWRHLFQSRDQKHTTGDIGYDGCNAVSLDAHSQASLNETQPERLGKESVDVEE